jgi:hypothetical protein
VLSSAGSSVASWMLGCITLARRLEKLCEVRNVQSRQIPLVV